MSNSGPAWLLSADPGGEACAVRTHRRSSLGAGARSEPLRRRGATRLARLGAHPRRRTGRLAATAWHVRDGTLRTWALRARDAAFVKKRERCLVNRVLAPVLRGSRAGRPRDARIPPGAQDGNLAGEPIWVGYGAALATPGAGRRASSLVAWATSGIGLRAISAASLGSTPKMRSTLSAWMESGSSPS